jgi:hypothetical protein
MATVKIETFGGISPRIHPTLLADGMAVTAHNCSLKTGKLVPLKQPRKVTERVIHLENGCGNPANAKSMHIWRHVEGNGFDFMLFPGQTWIAPGNVASDEMTRVVVSGDTGAVFTDRDGKEWKNTPVVYMREGQAQSKISVPIAKVPLPAPTATRTADQGELGDSRRYTRFFVSWVDRYGMESPISDPSWTGGEDVDVEYNDGDNISISVNGWDGVKDSADAVRIYKVVTGASEGRIQFMREVPKSLLMDNETPDSPTVSVKVKDENAGEIMPNIEAPPADLRCIRDVPGGFYCGISPSSPKTVFFSDIDFLYSWPVAYRYDIRNRIVALAVTSNSVVALTDGTPYVLTGTMPESMTVTKVAEAAACISPRGVCVYRNSVFFVSNTGLMMIGNGANEGTVCTNITDGIFTKEQWAALNPASCVIGSDKGALLLFFTLPDMTHRSYRIDLTEDSKVAVSTHDEAAACLVVDDATSRMYYIREGA